MIMINEKRTNNKNNNNNNNDNKCCLCSCSTTTRHKVVELPEILKNRSNKMKKTTIRTTRERRRRRRGRTMMMLMMANFELFEKGLLKETNRKGYQLNSTKLDCTLKFNHTPTPKQQNRDQYSFGKHHQPDNTVRREYHRHHYRKTPRISSTSPPPPPDVFYSTGTKHKDIQSNLVLKSNNNNNNKLKTQLNKEQEEDNKRQRRRRIKISSPKSNTTAVLLLKSNTNKKNKDNNNIILTSIINNSSHLISKHKHDIYHDDDDDDDTTLNNNNDATIIKDELLIKKQEKNAQKSSSNRMQHKKELIIQHHYLKYKQTNETAVTTEATPTSRRRHIQLGHHHHQRLSSSFKDDQDDDEDEYIDEDEEDDEEEEGEEDDLPVRVTRPQLGGFRIGSRTKGLFKMFKSSSSSSSSSSSVDSAAPATSGERLSKKFLNMILARHTARKMVVCDDGKIPLPKSSYSFRPVTVTMRRRNVIQTDNESANTTASLGLTLVGYCPCQVSKIEKDSIAQTCGLMLGDLIIKINGKNVSRATCESIVKLIKSQTNQKLKFEVLRATTTTTTATFISSTTSTTTHSQQVAPTTTTTLSSIIDEEPSSLIEQKRAAQFSLTSSSSTNNNNPAAAAGLLQHYHQLYHRVAASNSTENITARLIRPLNYTIDEEELIPNPNDDEVIVPQTSTTQPAQSNHPMPSPIPYLPPLTDSDYRTQSSSSSSGDTNDDISDHNNNNNNENDSQHQHQRHLNACESLLDLEERFIELMQRGVQQYSRPLRHCAMIAPQQHQHLFQNIEKILAITEYQLNQLISKDESVLLDMFASIGRLYENKMRMSCEAFDLYLGGVRQSFDLLDALTRSNPSLTRYLQDAQHDCNMSLGTFLLLPLHYVTQIQARLAEIRSHTNPITNDYVTISELITRLDSYCDKSRPFTSGTGSNPLVKTEKLDDSDEIVHEIEEDEEEYEDECPPVTTSPDLNLIYSSTLFYRQSCHKWKKIRALFFSDRCIMLDYDVRLRKFLHALESGEKLGFKHKTIYFGQINRVAFSQNQQRYRNEFVIVYSRKEEQKQQGLKLKCTSREEMLRWTRLFETYVNQSVVTLTGQIPSGYCCTTTTSSSSSTTTTTTASGGVGLGNKQRIRRR